MVTDGPLDPDTGSEFRQLLRDARGQLLRRVSVTNDEVQGLTDHESGALDDGSGTAVAAELLQRIGEHEPRRQVVPRGRDFAPQRGEIRVHASMLCHPPR